MRKLVVLSFISLDGVLQAPGGPEEDPTGGFHHGGWVAGYWDDLLGDVMTAQMAPPFDLLLGRKTYEIFAAHWPFQQDDFANHLNQAKKYVASNTLSKLDWSNSSLLQGDVAKEIQKLKQQDGPELHVHGSGNFIQTLLRHDLIDELRLKIFPVVLGKGKRLFAEGAVPAGFTLIDSQTSPHGVLVATYQRAGEVKTGSFAVENPSEAERARRRKLAAEHS